MRTSLFLFVVVAAVGCKKSEDAAPASGSAMAAPKPADPPPSPVAEEPMAPGSTASGIDISRLGPKLEYEKTHRGAGPSTDKVFEALQKAGYAMEERKQILAATANASYCENARVAGLVVVVCEYGSEKDATAGKASVDKKWAALNPNLERVVHGASVITIVHGGNKTADVPKILAAVNAV